MIKYIFRISNLIYRYFFIKNYFAFVQGHAHLNKFKISEIKNLLIEDKIKSDLIINEYESKFSKLIGKGSSVSFAAGRMTLYSLLKILKVKKNDEIIVQAGNCSVMINAILRAGAKPVFSDIDLDNLGTSPKSVLNLISKNTKMIIAQHSFGIPCEIDTIKKIAKAKNIFLLEDCALSLGSSYKKIKLGNWGDAALFSSDHTKPINTIIGGMMYSNNKKLIEKIKSFRDNLKDIKTDHQERLFNQFLFERNFYNSSNYVKGELISLLISLHTKIFHSKRNKIFLEDDYGHPEKLHKINYLYPSKLPAFIAKIGIYEIGFWKKNMESRIKILKSYKSLFINLGYKKFIPKAYFNSDNIIIPLRFAILHPKAHIIRNKMKNFIDVDSTWFMKPLVACENLDDLGYINGSCKKVELSCQSILNFPCVLHDNDEKLILKSIEKKLIM